MVEKEIHLRDYLRVAAKRKGIVFLFFVLTVSAFAVATLTATPKYMSSTKVLIEKNFGNPLSNRETYAPWDPEFLETQTQLIKSAAVIKNVVKQMGADRVHNKFFAHKKKSKKEIFIFWFKDQLFELRELIGIEKAWSSFKKEATNNHSSKNSDPSSKAEALIKTIQSGISVKLMPNTRILKIGYLSDNPQLSMEVANSVAQAYIDELINMQMEVAGHNIGWMKKKADIQRSKLEKSEKELQDYKTKHDIITVEDRLTVLPERLSVLSSNLTKAETRRKELFAVYKQIIGSGKNSLGTIPAIAENDSVETINKKILVTDQKISELSKKYGPKHPKMISAYNELTNLKNKKNSILEDAVKTIENEYLLAKENEQNLRELLERTKSQAALLGERSIQLGVLQRKVDTNRYLYDALVKKMEEKDITEKSQNVNVWVIEKADLPNAPLTPRKRRNIILGIMLGIMGGLSLSFFLEYLDNTIKTPEDVQKKFNIPVLSTIELLKNKKYSIVETVLQKTSSLTTESFKSLRTSVLLSSVGRPPKTILITSMTPGEGKSSIAVCLAASIAQTGKKTLLIDADMRRPTQHSHFSLASDSGLSSLLAGVTSMKDSVQFDVIENLDLITAGPIPPNPSELLSSKILKTLIDKFSHSYDMIILDSPPLSSVTDPVILSRNADGVIIVASAGRTTYETLGKGLEQLSAANAAFTGLVLNRFKDKKRTYHYSYKEDYSSVS